MTFKPVKLLDQPPTPLVQDNGELSKIFVSVIGDIFNKFDVIMGRELSYSEMVQLYKITGFNFTEEEFEILKTKYCSTKDGITIRGLKDFFKE